MRIRLIWRLGMSLWFGIDRINGSKQFGNVKIHFSKSDLGGIGTVHDGGQKQYPNDDG